MFAERKSVELEKSLVPRLSMAMRRTRPSCDVS